MRNAFVAVFISVLFFSVSGWATNYYIAANGNDSNNGTSKSTPWLHAPGMPACAANCKSKTPQPGDQFIFRGGDTWHFGNSAASPFVGGTCGGSTTKWSTCWSWGWSGSPGNLIYVGVDQTWYSGSSWTRPIMNGDNPLSTSAVASCAYDESYVNFLSIGSFSTQFDNFEFTGLCWHGNQSNANENICCSGYVNWGNSTPNTPSNNIISNFYVHGWTHRQHGCSLSGGEPTGDCDGAYGITSNNGGGNINAGNRLTGYVCDGSDTDKQSFGCTLWDAVYQFDSSYIGYAVQGSVAGNCHLWYNLFFENITYSFDGESHTNTFECQSEYPGVNYFYNIVVRNTIGLVWRCPNAGDFSWNIVFYGSPQAQPWDVDPGCGGAASETLENSTFVDAGNLGYNGNWGAIKNVLLINSTLQGTPTQTNNIEMTDAQAATAGFTSGSTFAYQPTSQNCNGQSSPTCPIGAGANLTSSWPSGFPTSDTGYACTYNATNHNVSCPARTQVARPTSGAWDVGAYQFAAPGRPAPPTGLAAVAQK